MYAVIISLPSEEAFHGANCNSGFLILNCNPENISLK